MLSANTAETRGMELSPGVVSNSSLSKFDGMKGKSGFLEKLGAF